VGASLTFGLGDRNDADAGHGFRITVAPKRRAFKFEIERYPKCAGHSLLARLASSAKVDEPYVPKQLSHASAEMTRRYQRRRDRFRANLTKAARL